MHEFMHFLHAAFFRDTRQFTATAKPESSRLGWKQTEKQKRQ